MNTQIKIFKKGLIVLAVLLFSTAYSNNIAVNGTNLSGQSNSAQTVAVKFDLQWENSWRNDITGAGNAAPFNWDAAWVFVKYRECGGVWKHATLSSNSINHSVPATASLNVGQTAGVGVGCFIYRASNGAGNFVLNNIGLRWEYGVDGLINTANVEIKVFAVEMVYITKGVLNLPTNGNLPGNNGFTPTWITFNPLSVPAITSENALPAGSLRWNGSMNGGYGGPSGSSTPLSNSYPKGFADFYCMKYSVTNEQYADFLNTLTYSQQASRVCIPPNSASGSFALICDLLLSGQYQQSNHVLAINQPGVNPITPAIFGCDFNANSILDEAGDGQNIICANFYMADETAYSDWSGLRPVSLLEYEKVCRGTNQAAVNHEYAWGTPNLCANTTFNATNPGQTNESIINTCNSATDGNGLLGTTNGIAPNHNVTRYPRAGVFATAASDRITSGATFYGVMNMTDTHLLVVGISGIGKNFSGPNVVQYPGNFDRNIHGNGSLNLAGDCDVTPYTLNVLGWPAANGNGQAVKGGSYCSVMNSNIAGRVSDLSNAAWIFTRFTTPYKWAHASIRCVRSAQ